MNDFPTILAQGGAVSLLGYLIFWLTQKGAPGLFEKLGGIQVAIEAHKNQLETINHRLEVLEDQNRQFHEEIRRALGGK